MTIWRINSDFGFRQSILFAAVSLFVLGAISGNIGLEHIRRYLGWLLAGSLLLTIATLFIGTNPSGYGANLWLGCCGIYLQPSEPLKLSFLLILTNLAAVDTQRSPWSIPLGIIAVLSVGAILAQKDIGTSMVFLAMAGGIAVYRWNKWQTLAIEASLLAMGLAIATNFVPLVRQRFETWLNPWQDVSGNSYQTIQSVIAIANGGLNGRGPGLGFPTVVPVAHSDFIFTAISEELGIIGALAVLMLFFLLVFIGFEIAKFTPDRWEKYIAAGVSIFLGAQALIIIGGNLNLIPLTGVPLPFLSYGGSSLAVSYGMVLLLYFIGSQPPAAPMAPTPSSSEKGLFFLFASGFLVCAFGLGYWGVIRNDQLLKRTENPRRGILESVAQRGAILDRANGAIVSSIGSPGSYQRKIWIPSLSPIVGYNIPFFGQTNIEAAYDDPLRGERGYPDLQLWWSHLVYGRPPNGINIRTTIDAELQKKLVAYYGNRVGAGILLNAASGELYALVSTPYISNDQLGAGKAQLPEVGGPLLNRISMGVYPTRILRNMASEIAPKAQDTGQLEAEKWIETQLKANTPKIGFDELAYVEPGTFTPLMAARLFSAISNAGTCAGLQFVSAVESPTEGWVILPASQMTPECILPVKAASFAEKHSTSSSLFWSATGYDTKTNTTFYVAGTMPEWNGTPLTLLVFYEKPYSSGVKLELDRLFLELLTQ